MVIHPHLGRGGRCRNRHRRTFFGDRILRDRTKWWALAGLAALAAYMVGTSLANAEPYANIGGELTSRRDIFAPLP